MRQSLRNLITHSGGFFKVFFDISWQLSVKKFVVFFVLFFLAAPLYAGITAKSYVVGKGSPFNTGYLLEADASDPSGAKAKSTSYTVTQILTELGKKLDVPVHLWSTAVPSSEYNMLYWRNSDGDTRTVDSGYPISKNVVYNSALPTANHLAMIKDGSGKNGEAEVGSSGVAISQIYGTGTGMLTLPGGGYTLPAATTSALGGLKLKQAAASVGTNGSGINTAGTTAGRYYPLNITADNNVAYVNVPWTEYTAGTGISISGGVISATGGGSYTLPAATNLALGGLKLAQAADATAATLVANTTTGGRNYRLKLDSGGIAYVNVPWSDTNTTYSAGSGIDITGNVISTTGSSNGFIDCSADWTPAISMSFSQVECHQSGDVVTVTFRFSPASNVSANCGNDWTMPCPGSLLYTYSNSGAGIGNVNSDDPSRHNGEIVKICTFSMVSEEDFGTAPAGIYEPGVMFLGMDSRDNTKQGLFFRSAVDAFASNDYGLNPPSTSMVDCTFVINSSKK